MIAKIHTTNEIPALGSGVRIVHVESKGYKWVRIKSLGALTCNQVRRTVYDKIVIAEFESINDMRRTK
jgi:hypothetical protein